MATPRAQVVCRLPGYTKCPSHTDNKVSFCCVTCDTLACIRCVTSRTHRGHEFEELDDAVKEATEKIQQILDTNETIDLVQIKNDLSSMKEQMTQNKLKHNEISDLIKLRVREIKEEAERQAEVLLSECEMNETENQDRLLDCQATLENEQRDCEEQIDRLKKTLQSGNEVEVFDTRNNTKTFDLGSPHSLKLATYQPSTPVSDLVEMALGSLDWPKKQRSQDYNPKRERWQHNPTAERWETPSRVVSSRIEQKKPRRRPQRNEPSEKFAAGLNNFTEQLTNLMQKASSDEECDTGGQRRRPRQQRHSEAWCDDSTDEEEIMENLRRVFNNNQKGKKKLR